MTEWDDTSAPVKAKRGKPEMLLQRAIRAYISRCVVGGFSWAVPNEVGNISKAYLMSRKANGVTAGAPDLVVVFHHGVCFMEMKAPRGTVSPSQAAVHDILRDCGQQIHVVRSIEDAEAALRAAGATLRRSKLSAPMPVQPLRAAG